MKTNRIIILLFLQNVITAALFVFFLFKYSNKSSNELVTIVIACIFMIPMIISTFLLGSGWLTNLQVKQVSIGGIKDNSVHEKLGKLFFAETLITGIMKKDFIDNNKNRLSRIIGIKNSGEIYELYSELNKMHAEYLKAEATIERTPIGFK